MSTNTKPFDKVQIGSVNAALWRNTDPEGRAYYSVSFEKRYRDGKGDWQSTGSFHRDDLLVIAKVADKAFDRIQAAQAEDRTLAAERAQKQTAVNAR